MSVQTLESLTGDYTIDTAHTRLGFAARHAMVTKVRGQFNEFEGTAHLDFADPSKSSAQVTIKAASIDTRHEYRDTHLRSNDFFDAPNHPEITFRSTSVEKVDDEHFRLTGDLTIKGTTKPVSIEFEFTGSSVANDSVHVGFEGSTTINRRDWKVEWNAPLEAGGVMVSDKITLEIEVEAVKVDPEA